MPCSRLFAVNNEGRVFGLPTNGTKWRELNYLGIDFKAISAAPNFLWAIGSDRQIYVHVYSLDIPIRVKEEAFENQRWLPMEGFTSRLLPTDRWQFSSEDGLTDRTLERIRVPSMAWQWEGDWHIETVMNGEPLDREGWTYAVDFPATYHSTKQWTSCVRRRKWVRIRRYCPMNSWCAVSPLHKDPTQEPFIDVSVGCHLMADVEEGSLQVWAVTAFGRVVWRKGVSHKCPEGARWVAINTPRGSEAKQISCGASGLVWVVLWSGQALVRTGIRPNNPSGDDWAEVESPEDGILPLMQVSVGCNAVWAATKDKRVWFRKGIKGEADASVELHRGIGWVEMVGNMSAVSVTSSDQVFAIGTDDRSVYFRTDVTPAELTGKRWKCLHAAAQVSRASSTTSSCASMRHRSTASLEDKLEVSFDSDSNHTSKSVPTSLKIQPIWHKPVQPSSLPASEGSVEEPSMINGQISLEEEKPQRKLTAWSPIRSVGSLLGLEANPETDPHADWDGVNYPEREPNFEPGWSQADTLWTSVEAGALTLDPHNLPNWFDSSMGLNFEKTSWRELIFNHLKKTNTSLTESYDYAHAVEGTSCVISIDCRCLVPGGTQQIFDECILEVEWIACTSSTIDTATISVFSIDRTSIKCQFSITEIVLIVSYSEPGIPKIAIHTSDTFTKGTQPLQFIFHGDNDYDEWMAHLTSIHAKIMEIENPPSEHSIWATTLMGDVYCFDRANLNTHQFNSGLYSVNLTQQNFESSPGRWSHYLTNGLSPDCSVTVNGFIPVSTTRFSINLDVGDTESQIALHLNPRFDQNEIVRNSKENDVWGIEETEGMLTLIQGDEFEVQIFCMNEGFKLLVNGIVFNYFEHRLSPSGITKIRIEGDINVHKVIYDSKRPIITLHGMLWKQMGGHLKSVETCAAGVTWGITYDCTPHVYTAGWGGLFLNGMEQTHTGVHQMVDHCSCYVYENQRWNPLNGFTSRGLPTDRPMWSDSTGLHKRSKDTTRLLSKHWRWISDWMVDQLTPGGVDAEGWQYAVDFSTSYHPHKNLTDYVRRRRWVRNCKLATSGPWQEVGNSKVVDISLQDSPALNMIYVWAVSSKGDALFRKGVSHSNPMGDSWEHVLCDSPLENISCGCGNQVWAVTKNGSSYWRFGITTSNPKGETWELVEPPKGGQIKKVSVSNWAVWALDTEGRIYIRKEVTPVFPEGTHWQLMEHSDFSSFKDVSASGDEVWALASTGTICRRLGVNYDNPAGSKWIKGITANWQTISVRSYTSKSTSRYK